MSPLTLHFLMNRLMQMRSMMSLSSFSTSSNNLQSIISPHFEWFDSTWLENKEHTIANDSLTWCCCLMSMWTMIYRSFAIHIPSQIARDIVGCLIRNFVSWFVGVLLSSHTPTYIARTLNFLTHPTKLQLFQHISQGWWRQFDGGCACNIICLPNRLILFVIWSISPYSFF